MWYLSLSQLFYISAADDLFGHFFLSTKWENANTGQSLSSSVQSLPDMWATSPMEKIPWGRSVWKHLTAMFEGGNLLNMNLTPVTNIPWKLCNFTSCVTQLQSHLCQHQSDLLLHFWGNCVNLHLPTTIGKHTQHVCASQHAQHVHTQKKLAVPAWNLLLFLHGPNIIITWVMQFITFKHVV